MSNTNSYLSKLRDFGETHIKSFFASLASAAKDLPGEQNILGELEIIRNDFNSALSELNRLQQDEIHRHKEQLNERLQKLTKKSGGIAL
jgi:hypothetical protein